MRIRYRQNGYQFHANTKPIWHLSSAKNLTDFLEHRGEAPELKLFEKHLRRSNLLSHFFFFFTIGLLSFFFKHLLKSPPEVSPEAFVAAVQNGEIEPHLKIGFKEIHFRDKRQKDFYVPTLFNHPDGISGLPKPHIHKIEAPSPRIEIKEFALFSTILLGALSAVYNMLTIRRSNELRALYNRFEGIARNLTGLHDKAQFEMNAVLKSLKKQFRHYRENEGTFQELIAARNTNTHFGWFWSTFAVSIPSHMVVEIEAAIDQLGNPLLLELTPHTHIEFEKPNTHIFTVIRRKMYSAFPYVFLRNERNEICVFSYHRFAGFAAEKINDGILDLTEVKMQDVVNHYQHSMEAVFIPENFSLQDLNRYKGRLKRDNARVHLLIITSDGSARGEVLGVYRMD